MGLAGGDAADVVGEHEISEIVGTWATDLHWAHMRHIEHPSRSAHGCVFGDYTGIFQGHQPAAEVCELGSERSVLLNKPGHLQNVISHAEQR